MVDNFVHRVWNALGDVLNLTRDLVRLVRDRGGEIVDDVINIVDGGGDGRLGVFNRTNRRVIRGGERRIDDALRVRITSHKKRRARIAFASRNGRGLRAPE